MTALAADDDDFDDFGDDGDDDTAVEDVLMQVDALFEGLMEDTD